MRVILNKHDPIDLYLIINAFDEYDPEIEEIYKKSDKVNDFDESLDLIHKTFIEFFDKNIAGKKEKYVKLSKDLFKILRS